MEMSKHEIYLEVCLIAVALFLLWRTKPVAPCLHEYLPQDDFNSVLCRHVEANYKLPMCLQALQISGFTSSHSYLIAAALYQFL